MNAAQLRSYTLSIAIGFLALSPTSYAETPATIASAHVLAWTAQRNGATPKGSIRVDVSNLQKQGGELLLGLYDAETPFPAFGKHLLRVTVPAHGAKVDAVFDNIPYGRYAIAVIDDANGNQRLDMTLGMIPAEPLGFSNNAKVGMFGPPKFQAAAFELNTPVVVLNVSLN